MTNIYELSIFNIYSYKDLIPHNIFCALVSMDTPHFPLGAEVDGEPAGAIVGYFDPQKKTAFVVSVYVSKSFRRRGIGSALFKAVEDSLKKRGAGEIKIIYTFSNDREGLPATLKKLGWSDPAPFHHVFKMDKKMMDSPFMKYRKLKQDYSYVTWKNFSPGEREILKGQNWYLKKLSPFAIDEDRIEPERSLILKYRSEVVGWLIMTVDDDETLFYNISYVREDLQRLGRMISIFAEAGSIQVAENKYPYASGRINAKNTGMVRFVDKYIKPYAVMFQTEYESSIFF